MSDSDIETELTSLHFSSSEAKEEREYEASSFASLNFSGFYSPQSCEIIKLVKSKSILQTKCACYSYELCLEQYHSGPLLNVENVLSDNFENSTSLLTY